MAKVWAFIISSKFFCDLSKICFSETNLLSGEELPFFERVAKVVTFTHSTKFFGGFFSSIRNLLFEELTAFFRADGKDTVSIFIGKVFLSLVINISLPLFNYSCTCRVQRTGPFCQRLSTFIYCCGAFSSHFFSLAPGVYFKSGCKDKQLHIAAKSFLLFFISYSLKC